MKALSLTQPWAHLVMLGEKRWETRSWRAFHRGEVAIHAAKGYPPWARDYTEEFHQWLGPVSGREHWLQFGKIIAIANLVDCQPTNEFRQEGYTRRDSDPPKIEIGDAEFRFGDFTPGRFAFKLENVRRITPIECKGALGFWTVPDSVELQIREEIDAEKHHQLPIVPEPHALLKTEGE